MEKQYKVSTSPHVRSKITTSNIMRDVVIALLPISAWGIYKNGSKAFVLIMVCILASLLAEYVCQKIMKQKVTITDFSAVITGLLIALNLPPYIKPWMAAIGCIFAIVIVKQMFGGLGQNFMNPALAARCFLMMSFSDQMTVFYPDGVTGATPLQILKEGAANKEAVSALMDQNISVMDMFLGNTAGTIGETSALLILIGAAYLLIRKVIRIRIPAWYIGSFTMFMLVFSGQGMDVQYLIAEICGGGLLLGAFFMATDYVTSPITKRGQMIYGIALGMITGVFRIYSGSAEGVSYAIIFCNLLVPLIEKVTIPKAFGREALRREK